VDKEITHIHEGFTITPSCKDNDVHNGLQWAILNRSVVYDPLRALMNKRFVYIGVKHNPS